MFFSGDCVVEVLNFSLEAAYFDVVLLELFDVSVTQLVLLQLRLPAFLFHSFVHLVSQRFHLFEYKAKLSKLMDLAFKHLIELQQRPASFDVFNNYKFKFVRALLFSLTGEAT
jgi:hypothetical protein